MRASDVQRFEAFKAQAGALPDCETTECYDYIGSLLFQNILLNFLFAPDARPANAKIIRLMCYDAEIKSLDSVRARLASFLYIYTNGVSEENKDVILTQEELACIVNASIVQVSRIAKEFKDKGWIDYKRGHITVVDREKMYEIANGR